jgi:hypothetical protein
MGRGLNKTLGLCEMTVNCKGREYEIIFASDADRDGVYLELSTANGGKEEVLLYAFWSDASQAFTFSAFREELPFELVEVFVAEARRRLPPTGNVPV